MMIEVWGKPITTITTTTKMHIKEVHEMMKKELSEKQEKEQENTV